MTIAKILERVKAAQDERARMERERKEAEERGRTLKQQADAAAAAGDVDKYLRLKGEFEREDAVAYVRKTQLEQQADAVSQQDIEAGWNSYSSEYGKKLSALRAEYEKSVSAALSVFRKMIDLQHEALCQRRELAELSGLHVDFANAGTVEFKFPMEYVLPGGNRAEGVYFRVGQMGAIDPNLAFYFAHLGHDRMLDLCRDDEARRLVQECVVHLPA